MSDPVRSYSHLLEHLREPLLIASASGRILAANAAAAEALGTSVAAVVGTMVSSFGDHAEPRDLTNARPFPLRARDGRSFVCDVALLEPDVVLLRLSGGPDAGPRARLFFESLVRLHGIPGSGADTSLAEASRAWIRRWMNATGAVAVGVHELDTTAAMIELVAQEGYTPEAASRFRLVPLAEVLPVPEAIRRRELIVMGTEEEYAAVFPHVEPPEFVKRRASVVIPLLEDGQCFAAIALGFELPRAFSDQEREVFRTLAVECAESLAQARRADAKTIPPVSERTASQLARMQAFTGALAKAITPAEVTEVVVDMGMAASSARSGGLWLLSPDGKLACLARGVGPTGPRAADHQNIPIDQPFRMPILDAVQNGTPVWLESCRQFEDRYPDAFRVFSRGGESALACLPLFAQGRCIGGLALNYEGKHEFLEDERAFLQVLAWYSAQAIESSRQHAAAIRARQAAEANQRRSDFLADSSVLLTSSLDYASTLAGVARAAVPRVADWCIVELAEDRQTGALPVAAHVDPAKVPFVLELSRRFRADQPNLEGGIQGVIRSGKSHLYPVITPAALAELFRATPALAELYTQTGITSSMVVPIAARGRTLGAIVLNSASSGRTYDEHDLAMAEELGRIAGLAVDNARLHRDVIDADRRKDEFLAMLSHELRNPLSPIVTTLQLMDLRGGDTGARERAVISRQVQHLVRLVDDLLDVARVTRGKIQLKPRRCDLAQLIGTAVEMVCAFANERRHDLTIDVRDALAVTADPDRIAQTLANVLINAIKYTEPGGTISVIAAAEHGEAVIRVRDSGIGIAPEVLPTIFELFTQAKTPHVRSTGGGLGVGLTVVRRLIELHGGTVAASSAGIGYGTELVIRLPLAADRVEPSVPSPDRGPTRRRALVVEDNVDAAEWLCEALDELGYMARVAHDGDSALIAAAELEPHVALIDIGLPGMTGYELATRLRESAPTTTRLVALTGYGEESDLARSREAGFDEHLVKPVGLDELRGILERAERATRVLDD